jgi:hypothetical protein
MSGPRPLPEYSGLDAQGFAESVVGAYRPAVFRGLANDWPAVRAARRGPESLADLLKGFDRGAPAEVFEGRAAIKGRYFYRDDMAGFNFERRRQPLSQLLDALLALPEAEPPVSLYAGAVATDEHLPGFREAHAAPLVDARIPPRAWIGNAHVVAAHFDLSDNLACVVSGARRFLLFPPEQAQNLYVGPLDHTIAGQPASMAQAFEPDLARFPRLAEALAAAEVADLEPGDAIYIPSLWWHAVRSTGRLNMLVNYWWSDEPADAGSPFEAMVHGLMAIAALPEPRRAAWRAMFDHYVFRTGGEPAPHLAPEHRGVLGASTAEQRRRIRAFLMQGLSRR